MAFLSRLQPVMDDPIFKIAEEAKRAGSLAINASIGEIRDEEGKPFVLDCVRRATEEWYALAMSPGGFPYPPLLGLKEFKAAVTRLVFGDFDTIASIAATGGTGAIALNLKLLKHMGTKRVILTVPTWPTHRRLLLGEEFQVTEVERHEEDMPSLAPLLDALNAGKDPAGIILQASGHNPTGKGWTEDQWRELAAALAGSSHVVLLDAAYQGLCTGVAQDIAPVGILRQAGVNLLVAWSASKNHTIYGLRTGLACAVGATPEECVELEKHYAIFARELHSAAPTPGQCIVASVQEKYRKEWEEELVLLRELIDRKRALLVEAFPAWAPALEGCGLYAMLPAGQAVVQRLKEEKVFLTEDGRVNIAGIPLKRMDEFIEKIRKVL